MRQQDKPIEQLDEEVEIEATIEHPGKWSKTVVLVPLTRKSGDFRITFPLDLNRFTEISNTIQQETGVSASAYNLTIKANVHVTGQTDFGTIDEDFTQPPVRGLLYGYKMDIDNQIHRRYHW